MISKVISGINEGIDGQLIAVETDIYRRGLPKFNIIGLPDNAVKEAKDRVKSAILNSKIQFPNGVITVNLAPASIKKTGSMFDLAIAVSIVKATGQVKSTSETDFFFSGELSLDGSIRKVAGLLPVILKAREMGICRFFIPRQNAAEAAVIDGITIIPADTLEEVIAVLNRTKELSPVPHVEFSSLAGKDIAPGCGPRPDFGDIAGQLETKRAVEIAVAGRHNILMIGPPGAGKSMLAARIPGIMPDLSFQEALETTKIYSSKGLLDDNCSFITRRPFRSPHHSSSEIALIGGGSLIQCGEISLSHNGVLFLDEFPEFNKNVIQALREPLENRSITISRASGSMSFPANLLLVAAMNPCPCGFLGDEKRSCLCSSIHIQKYYQKLSGPILDRIDIHVNVPRIDVTKLNVRNNDSHYTTSAMKERIQKAVEMQKRRFGSASFRYNCQLSNEEIFEFCRMTPEMQNFLNRTVDKLALSLRAYFKILKLARTIADLDGSPDLTIYHLSEAVQYRILDRYNHLFSL